MNTTANILHTLDLAADEDRELAAFCKALAHPARVRILRHLVS